MHYHLSDTAALSTNTTLVLGIFADKTLDLNIPFVKKHETQLMQLLSQLNEGGDIVWQTIIEQHAVLIIHCGEKSVYTEKKLTQYLLNIISVLLKNKSTSVLLCMPQLSQRTADWQLKHMHIQCSQNCYQYLEYKTQGQQVNTLQNISFYLPGANADVLISTQAIADGIYFARNLANTPANICTPTYLANQALQLAKQYSGLIVKHFDRDALKKMGMNTLLAVAQGSHESPQLIEIHHNGGAKDSPPIILIGKGITFDSGGISLKPPANMGEMKYDMSGAASVMATLQVCAQLKLPLNVIGLMACAENMPGGAAVKPGDVIKSAAGLTIEITNTDAEGRLVLADALYYAQQFKPSFVIDIATLTGAVVVALGHIHSGIMTNDEELSNFIQQASDLSQDTAWRLPLDEEYKQNLDSPIADMVNSTETRDAGSITAGCFLSRFIDGYRWAHLDIAGTAWVSGKKHESTGRPVGLLVAILQQALQHKHAC